MTKKHCSFPAYEQTVWNANKKNLYKTGPKYVSRETYMQYFKTLMKYCSYNIKDDGKMRRWVIHHEKRKDPSNGPWRFPRVLDEDL